MKPTPIPGVDGYLVDEAGVVWSAKQGRHGRYRALHAIKPWRDSEGYLHVTLRPDGEKKRLAVHVLVALAFLGERPAGSTVAHLDGNTENNAPTNLAYVSQRENIGQKWEHGTMVCGERSNFARLDDATAARIWRRVQAGATKTEIAQEFGVSKAYVTAMRQGRVRKHITGIGLTLTQYPGFPGNH